MTSVRSRSSRADASATASTSSRRVRSRTFSSLSANVCRAVVTTSFSSLVVSSVTGAFSTSSARLAATGSAGARSANRTEASHAYRASTSSRTAAARPPLDHRSSSKRTCASRRAARCGARSEDPGVAAGRARRLMPQLHQIGVVHRDAAGSEALSVAIPRVERMIESLARAAGPPVGSAVGMEELELLLARLAAPSPATTDAERVDRLRAMERVKNALAAAQAAESVAFDASQRAEQIEAGWGEHRLGRGIADQVALARMESPHKGSRLLGLAKALVHEMPKCLAALQRGEVSEWRVTGVARETAHLRVEDRRAVDSELGPRLHEMGDRQAAGSARAMAQRLDPAGAAERARRAERERRVSIRPAPDAMTYVTALLPMREGVSVFAALTRLAKDARADGDERGKGQIMADALVERVTGHAVGPCRSGSTSSCRTPRFSAETAPRPAFRATARFPPRSHAPGCAPRSLRGSSPSTTSSPSAACSPAPTSATSSRWSRRSASSPGSSGTCSSCATRPAERRGVGRRYGTATMCGGARTGV
ncbi:DUF222 domain-containing protein [Nostocoides sp. F2B08]|nr:DUF222 domain-containing protein [Tetrasphaera sp. F2B08]